MEYKWLGHVYFEWQKQTTDVCREKKGAISSLVLRCIHIQETSLDGKSIFVRQHFKLLINNKKYNI